MLKQTLTPEVACSRTERNLMWLEESLGGLRRGRDHLPPSILSWVSLLPPESQQSSQARYGQEPVSVWVPFRETLYSSQGQVTSNINDYFCLLPVASIFEWET